MRLLLPWALVAWAGCSSALAAPSTNGKGETPPPADISAIKDKLTVFADGKQHFIAMVLTTNSDSPVFWSSDGKEFYQLRIFGGGSEGGDEHLKRLDRVFWEPRVNAPYQASFEYKKDDAAAASFEVQCSTRKTPLKALPADEAKKLVDGGKFYQARWNHRAYALARDNRGKYYYVDRQREPEEAKSFRLWAGPKGAMKPQKMVNVVSDSQGDIFSTRSGELRLILNKQETTWIQGAKPTKLTWVPVEDNHILIYTDLGVYTGEPLGTPCDDL
jgi:hypothetical protein